MPQELDAEFVDTQIFEYTLMNLDGQFRPDEASLHFYPAESAKTKKDIGLKARGEHIIGEIRSLDPDLSHITFILSIRAYASIFSGDMIAVQLNLADLHDLMRQKHPEAPRLVGWIIEKMRGTA